MTPMRNAASSCSKKRKLEYSKDEWDALLNTIPVSKRSLDALVMDYLIIEGYQSTAQKFASEANLVVKQDNVDNGSLSNSKKSSFSTIGDASSNTSNNNSYIASSILDPALPDTALGLVRDRMAIKSLILAGKIQEAIELINDVDPELLDTHPQLHFELLRLQLIELIRMIPPSSSSTELTYEAIAPVLDFAVAHLAKRASMVPEFLTELEHTMALLCTDPSTMKTKAVNTTRSSLLDLQLRTTVAQHVNTTLLATHGLPGESKITDLVKLWGWTEHELGNSVIVDKEIFS